MGIVPVESPIDPMCKRDVRGIVARVDNPAQGKNSQHEEYGSHDVFSGGNGTP